MFTDKGLGDHLLHAHPKEVLSHHPFTASFQGKFGTPTNWLRALQENAKHERKKSEALSEVPKVEEVIIGGEIDAGAEIKKLRSEKDGIQSKYEEVGKKVKAIEESKSELQASYEAVTRLNAENESKVKASEESKSELQSLNAENESKVKALEESKSELQGSYEAVTRLNAENESKVKALEESKSELQARYEAVTRLNAENESKLGAMVDRTKALGQKVRLRERNLKGIIQDHEVAIDWAIEYVTLCTRCRKCKPLLCSFCNATFNHEKAYNAHMSQCPDSTPAQRKRAGNHHQWTAKPHHLEVPSQFAHLFEGDQGPNVDFTNPHLGVDGDQEEVTIVAEKGVGSRRVPVVKRKRKVVGERVSGPLSRTFTDPSLIPAAARGMAAQAADAESSEGVADSGNEEEESQEGEDVLSPPSKRVRPSGAREERRPRDSSDGANLAAEAAAGSKGGARVSCPAAPPVGVGGPMDTSAQARLSVPATTALPAVQVGAEASADQPSIPNGEPAVPEQEERVASSDDGPLMNV